MVTAHLLLPRAEVLCRAKLHQNIPPGGNISDEVPGAKQRTARFGAEGHIVPHLMMKGQGRGASVV